MKQFLERKGVVISVQRYVFDALSGMALGLFATLIVGLIIKTAGQQTALWLGENSVSTHLIALGTMSMQYMGAAIGVAVAFKLQASPLIMLSSAVTGSMGAISGGPAGAFAAALVGCEIGKLISKETPLDILLTPMVTLSAGYLVSLTVSPVISALMKGFGAFIVNATELQPFFAGMIVSISVGLALSSPISSAALAIMLNLSGLAAGAATAGCAASMIGFAVMSYKENGFGGLIAQGLGTSKLQLPNIMRNPWILLPPTLASAITGALSATVFRMENIAYGAGMGTSGLVGQITTLQTMGFTPIVLMKILLLHFILPAGLTLFFAYFLRKWGKFGPEHVKLHLD